MGLLINKDTIYEDGQFKKVGAKKATEVEDKQEAAPEVKNPAPVKVSKPVRKAQRKPSAALKAMKQADTKADGEKPAEAK